jgi:hypothetical protein
MRLSVFIVLFFIILFSCKKENPTPIDPNLEPPLSGYVTIIEEIDTQDTLKSNKYLAAYPGSWWKYSDGYLSTCSNWERITVRKKTISSDTIYIKKYFITVPKLNSYYVFQTNVLNAVDVLDSSKLRPKINLTPGYFGYYSESFGTQIHSYKYYSFGVLDSLVVNNVVFYKVLYIEEDIKVSYKGEAFAITGKSKHFYAKNIGLIRTISESIATPIDTIDVVEYYISPP